MWAELRALREGIDYGTPPRDGEAVSLTIDGTAVSVPAGSSVMLAAAVAGEPIPKLCATDTLAAFGSCRVCLVEVEGKRGYPASCTMLVEPGMVVRTQSDALTRLRKSIVELYLSHFPASEVPDGWTEFHEVLDAVGVKDHPYGNGRTHHDAPIDKSNPYFLFDPGQVHRLQPLRARLRRDPGHLRAHHPGPRLRIRGGGEPGGTVPPERVRELRGVRAGMPDPVARREKPVRGRLRTCRFHRNPTVASSPPAPTAASVAASRPSCAATPSSA